MRYLLAAEADKIQDFIFRSSRLREVVGASQLLSRFCKEGAPPLLHAHGGDPKTDIVVNDGGSFRIIFEDPDLDQAQKRASDFAADMAELYRLSVGGTLSVAKPVELNEDFRAANKEADKALRRAKEHRQGAVAEPHMPYVAFCASCGIALAERHGRLSGEPASVRPRYLCRDCQAKARERDRKPHAILDRFFEAYCRPASVDLGSAPDPDWPEDADDVAGFDLRQRNYVAYLIADGNNMGQIFRECDEEQIQRLSNRLPHALSVSLAQPAAAFRKVVPGKEAMIPVLPLILGGDDLFALIPAPYALEFACRFCLAYEEELGTLVQELCLHVPKPTVAAAVVICKSKYPYALAHRRAEELLAEAKRQSKLLAAHFGEHLSAVNFEVILGNRLAGYDGNDEEWHRAVRTTLRPYWAVKKGTPLSERARSYGIGLHQLLAQRLALKDVPNKRLVELRRHFSNLPSDITIINRQEYLEAWTTGLNPLLTRSGKVLGPKLQEAMEALGQPLDAGTYRHHWREMYGDRGVTMGHGMLDLLEAWDFAQDLDNVPEMYEAEESK
jgi:hypothetical protein